MSGGLIDAAMPGDGSDRTPAWNTMSDAFHGGRIAAVETVRALLRSDHTRANLSHTVYTFTAVTPAEADEIVDALVRQLAGEDGAA